MKSLRRMQFHSAGRLLLWNYDKKQQKVGHMQRDFPRKCTNHCRRTGHNEDNCWEKHPDKAPEWWLLKKRSEAREGPPPPTG